MRNLSGLVVVPVLMLVSAGRAQLYPAQILGDGTGAQITVTDVKLDGHPDVVWSEGVTIHVSHWEAGGAYVDFNIPLIGLSLSFVVARLDSDSLPDIACIEALNSRVHIQRQVAPGVFAYVGNLQLGGTFPTDIVAMDLDLDGRTDLVVPLMTSNEVAVLLSGSLFNFGYTETDYPLGAGHLPTCAALLDGDPDGLVDIVLLNGAINVVSVLNGTLPHGSFLSALAVGPASNPLISSMVTANMDGLGQPDLVWVDDTYQVRYDRDTGLSYSAFAGPGVTVTGSTQALAVGNLDGTGLPELAVCTGDVTICRDAGGLFVVGSIQPGLVAAAVQLADLDLDGRVDLIVSTGGAKPRTLAFHQSDIPPSYAFGVGVSVRQALDASPRDVAVGDITGDGVRDAVIACGDAATVTVVPGTASGGLGGTPASYPTADTPEAVALGKLNGDAFLDAVTVSGKSDHNACKVSVLLGNGSGGLGSAATMLLTAVSAPPRDVVLVDLDANGTLDVVTATEGDSMIGGGALFITLNDGSGTLGAPTLVNVGGKPQALAVGDMNGDGKPDVLTANKVQNTVAVLLGNGTGGLSAPTAFAASSLPSSAPTGIAAGDLDEDGDLDVVVTHSGSDSVSRLLGDGAGSLGAPIELGQVFVDPDDVQIADVNADGHLDIVIANSGDDSVVIDLGVGNGTFFTLGRSFATEGRPVALALADLDGDSFLDLFAALKDGNEVLYDMNLLKDRFAIVGSGLAGTTGVPTLTGSGTLAPKSPVKLTLANAKPASTWTLIIGFSALNAPFKGGTLVPSPNVLIFGLPTLGGTLPLSGTWPKGLTGIPIYFQGWISDGAGPAGFAASNGLKATGG